MLLIEAYKQDIITQEEVVECLSGHSVPELSNSSVDFIIRFVIIFGLQIWFRE